MNLDFFTVMLNLVSLFVLIFIGFFAVKLKILKPDSSVSFSSLLMNITLPCTIFISLVSKEYDPVFIHDSLIIIFIGILIFPFMLYSSRYISRIIKVPENDRGIWAFSCAFTNAGFMGFPIALSLFGPEGMALAVMLNIAFNIHVYTIGALEISLDNKNHSDKLNIKKIIFSNINFALVLSLIFYFGRINLPTLILRPINYLSEITTPLSMIIIGMALGKSDFGKLFYDKNAWTCSFMRLLIFPVIFCILFRFLPLRNSLIKSVTILVISMPAPSVTSVLAEMYHGNTEFAAKIMFIQNLFCILTIPLICMIMP